WNDPRVPIPAEGGLVHALVAAQAAATPDAVAVVSGTAGDIRLTHGELAARTRRLARYLRRLGAGPEAGVGLAAARGPEMGVAPLGTPEPGAASLPLDPALPAERLGLMLAAAQPQGGLAVATAARLAAPLADPARTVVCLDRDAAALAAES